MHVTDRAKDVIKSGGEWISSIDIENLAAGHPDVAEAAVIGVAHPKGDERPLLVVVAKEGRRPNPADVLGFLEGRIAKWWMPDDMQTVKEIPHTATGKINKLRLREAFKDYKLPTGCAGGALSSQAAATAPTIDDRFSGRGAERSRPRRIRRPRRRSPATGARGG